MLMSIFVLSFVLCPNRQASLYAFKQPYRPANEAIHSFLLSCACLTSNSKSEPFSTDRRHATDDLAGFLLKRIAMSVWHSFLSQAKVQKDSFKTLSSCGFKPAIRLLIPPYSDTYVLKVNNKLPKPLIKLYDEQCVNDSFRISQEEY